MPFRLSAPAFSPRRRERITASAGPLQRAVRRFPLPTTFGFPLPIHGIAGCQRLACGRREFLRDAQGRARPRRDLSDASSSSTTASDGIRRSAISVRWPSNGCGSTQRSEHLHEIWARPPRTLGPSSRLDTQGPAARPTSVVAIAILRSRLLHQRLFPRALPARSYRQRKPEHLREQETSIQPNIEHPLSIEAPSHRIPRRAGVRPGFDHCR